jgi:hypothetical protein
VRLPATVDNLLGGCTGCVTVHFLFHGKEDHSAPSLFAIQNGHAGMLQPLLDTTNTSISTFAVSTTAQRPKTFAPYAPECGKTLPSLKPGDHLWLNCFSALQSGASMLDLHMYN